MNPLDQHDQVRLAVSPAWVQNFAAYAEVSRVMLKHRDWFYRLAATTFFARPTHSSTGITQPRF
jgi:hypothetical protein